MKTFTMYRQDVPKETHPPGAVNAPDDPQFQGVLFDDGTVAIRWMTEFKSSAPQESPYFSAGRNAEGCPLDTG